MKKRIFSIVSLVMIMVLLSTSVVLAASWTYKFPTTFKDTSTVNRTYYPAMLGEYGMAGLQAAGYINATGNNTNMQIATTSIKYMLSTTNATCVIPTLPAYGQVTTDLYTGYNPEQTAFAIVCGEDGYLLTADNAGIELTDNFTYRHDGYINTDGAGHLVKKDEAFGVVQGSGNVTAYIGGADQKAVYFETNTSSATMNSAARWLAQTITLDNDVLVDNITAYTKKTLGNPGNITLYITGVNATTGNTPDMTNIYLSETVNANAWGAGLAWNEFDVSNTILAAGEYAIVLQGLSTDAANSADWGYDAGGGYAGGVYSITTDSGATWTVTAGRDFDFRIYTPEIQVSATGISSGERTVVVSANENLLFDDTNDYIDCGSDASLNITGQITVGAWINTPLANDDIIMSKGDFTGGGNTSFFFYSNNVGRLVVATNRGAAGAIYQTAAGVLEANTYTYVSYSFNPSTDVVSVYKNGQLVSSGAITATPSSEVADPLYIGALKNGAGLINPFNGTIHEIIIYNTVLDAGEHEDLFNNNIPSGYVAYWKLNEGAGVNAYDENAVSNGTISGATWLPSGGLFRIYIDSVLEDYNAGASVPGNANDYEFMNAGMYVPYANSIDIEIDGVDKIHYEPTSMLTGNTLPNEDSPGTYDATVIWGTNTGLTVTYGAMEVSDDVSAVTATEQGFSVPSATMPTNWFGGGSITGAPFYDTLDPICTDAGIPTLTVYQWLVLGISIAVFLLVAVGTRSALAAAIAGLVILFIGVDSHILALWVPFTIAVLQFAMMYLYKKVGGA